MTELIFLLPAFVACLVLTGIHTYLGVHVIEREVIFLDIALAQMAALGMTVGHLWHFEPDSMGAYGFALGFAALGAVIFTLLRTRRVPQEALIGVAFAVSSALAVLVADRLPHGGEHLKYIISGNILWVTWPQIIKTLVIYSLIGVLHFKFRRQFLLLSKDPVAAAQQGIKVRRWDLLFYLSFGAVITSSVQIGGILLVFSFLIVPALCSQLFFTGIRARLFFGWVAGVLCSVAGITASYHWDLPTGPAIVTIFGVMVLLCFMFYASRVRRA